VQTYKVTETPKLQKILL